MNKILMVFHNSIPAPLGRGGERAEALRWETTFVLLSLQTAIWCARRRLNDCWIQQSCVLYEEPPPNCVFDKPAGKGRALQTVRSVCMIARGGSVVPFRCRNARFGKLVRGLQYLSV